MSYRCTVSFRPATDASCSRELPSTFWVRLQSDPIHAHESVNPVGHFGPCDPQNPALLNKDGPLFPSLGAHLCVQQITQAHNTIIALARENTEQATKIEVKLIRVQSSIDQTN